MTNREKFKMVFGKDIHWSSSIEPQILALRAAHIDGIDCMEEWLNAEYKEPTKKQYIETLLEILMRRDIQEKYQLEKGECIKNKNLSQNPFELINTKLPYPLCIVEDRYCGVYSEARFLAFNMEPFSVQELPIDASDIACESFWNGEDKDYDINDYIIGKGKTPEEAVWNLILLLRKEDEI